MSINQHFVEKLRRNDEILTDLIDYVYGCHGVNPSCNVYSIVNDPEVLAFG